MKTIWETTYQGTEIRVENSWFGGEKLFVNNRLQDHTISVSGTKLTGVMQSSGRQIDIKVNLCGLWTIRPYLFVNHEYVEIIPKKRY